MTVEELRDEISAIDAIYPNSISEIAPNVLNIYVPQHENLSIQISFPNEYPTEMPNVVQVLTNDSYKYKDLNYIENLVQEELNKIFRTGDVCIFELVSELEEILERYNQVNSAKSDQREAEMIKKLETSKESNEHVQLNVLTEPKEDTIDPINGWVISDPILDRGSTFIAYAREVHSVKEAQKYLNILITDKKISKAAHNISCWRIKAEGDVQYQDFDDDGETAAGSRLLHLLTMIDVWNVMVVVSRWFGGTHLGPDRFKHINSAARDVIINGKFDDATRKNSSNNPNQGKRKKR